MSATRETEVLVVGAGPVGLVAALCLAERGVRTRVIDSYHRAALHSYAPALHPATLRLLDKLGIADDLIAVGRRVDRIAVHRERADVEEFDLAAVGGDFPHALVVPQTLLEGLLEKRLEPGGSRVEWRHQLMSLSQDDDGGSVSAQVARMGEDPGVVAIEHVEADFVILADGYNSFGRRALGIEMVPANGVLRYGLLETATEFEPRNVAQLVLGESTSDVFWPLPEDCGRWSIQLAPDEDADSDSLREQMHERAAWFPKQREPVEWTTLIDFKPRLARRFGRGRIWMAGDCARFTSPIGVQSMNVGMREADDLTRRMTKILRKRGSQELLPIYNEERRREWLMLLGLKDRLREHGETRWPKDWVSRLISTLPASGSDLNRLLEQVGYRLHWSRHESGRDTTTI